MHTVRYAPDTMEALCDLLSDDPAHFRVMGGGTNLAISLRREKKRPRALIWLGDLEDARGIRVTEEGVEIGAMTTMAELSASAVLTGPFGALSQAARTVGSEQVRGMVTLGGNIAGAFYGADTIPPLLLLQAEVQAAGPAGLQWRPIQALLPGGESPLQPDEALVSVRIPRPASGEWKSVFYKLGRRQTATLALMSLAMSFRLKGETIKETRIYLGALGPVPLEVPEVKKTLNGRSPDEKAAQILSKTLERFIKTNITDSDYHTWAIKAVVGEAMAKLEL